MNVNFEPIIRGLKSDIFDWDQVQNPFQICRIQLQKKKSGVEKCLLRRGGVVRRLVEKYILNFCFDYLTISRKIGVTVAK